MAMEANRTSWEQSIALCREAEQALGVASGRAAKAVCMAAEMFVCMGDFKAAQAELKRVDKVYGLVIDDDTAAEVNRLMGWIEYFQGNLMQAKEQFEKCIEISKKTGVPEINHRIQHFLGRVYFDLSELTTQRELKYLRLQASKEYFERGYEYDRRWGGELNWAYALMSKAQILQKNNQWSDVRKLWKQAKEHSRYEITVAINVDLAEARLDLRDNVLEGPKSVAQEALNIWTDRKYAEGVALALQILGEIAYRKNDTGQALELYTAALCVYPFPDYSRSRLSVKMVDELSVSILHHDGFESYQKLLQQIRENAKTKQGPFSCLDQIPVNRDADIENILGNLTGKV
jgi:tetratricopeptide (TPR) repeat protein